ncbi:GNAT family N-acetyltransferase [Sanguibacter sp. 25GB23B1]|uniref:GNAT family N-acetyltransferase n=1 Tax=unclassified Sanguibacter TaxID=2645534 RepID=UPI0032AF9C2C
MTTTPPRTSIVPLAMPASLDASDAWALLGAVRVDVAVQRETWGHADLTYPAEMLLVLHRDDTHSRRAAFLAVTDPLPATPGPGDVHGVAHVHLPLDGNTHLAEISVAVDPARQHEGIGGALLTEAEAFVAALGRTVVILDSAHAGEPAADDPQALTPPTGSGRIRADHPAAVFAIEHDYAFEQAERYSVLHVPEIDPDALAQLADDAAHHAGDDYRVVTWTDRCPDERVDDWALLATRMSTDVPLAALDLTEDPWDAARIRDDERTYADSGRGYVVCAAEHVPTGRLVAYTEITYPLAAPEIAYQDDTLVLREHRGHRLGMLVKTANLRELARLRPSTLRIHTWNAEENAHMLAINVALGFRPTGVLALWQRRLGADV